MEVGKNGERKEVEWRKTSGRRRGTSPDAGWGPSGPARREASRGSASSGRCGKAARRAKGRRRYA